MKPSEPDHQIDAWLERSFAGELTSAEGALLARWIDAAPDRRALVTDLRDVWQATARPSAVDIESLRQAMWHRIAATTSREVIPRVAAGSVARSAGRPIGRWMGAVVAGALMMLGAGLTFRWVRSGGTARDYVTARGQRLAVTLVDGTRVTLAPESHLRTDAAYGVAVRELTLEGEAYFAVVHDARRPLQIRTPQAVVRDVGTAFDVRTYGDDRTTRVAVAEGEVSVCRRIGSACQDAGAGDVAIASAADVGIVHNDDVAAYTAWMQGQLVFRDTPLPDVIRQLSRTYDLNITLADSALARETLTASFSDYSADQVLAAVAHAVGAQYERRGRTIVIRAGGMARRPVLRKPIPLLTTVQSERRVVDSNSINP